MEVRWVLEWSLVVVSIVGLWSTLSLPIIFFVLEDNYRNNRSFDSELSVSQCEFPRLYSNGICLEAFSSILNSSDRQEPVLVSELNEAGVVDAIEMLNEINSSLLCTQNMLPFLCLHFVGLCDGNRKLVLTAGQCELIQNETCIREWTLISSLGIDIPDCEDLPAEQYISYQRNSVICEENFYFDEDFEGCVPSCPTWSEVGEAATIVLRVIVLTFVSIGIILSIAVIIISILKHKLMFQFPTAFLVFSTLDVMLMYVIALVGYSNSSLFCSSPTIVNNTSTPFCIISGMLFNYCYIQLSLWWMFHLFIIFWGVWFPFHYNKFKSNGNLRKVSIVLTVIGILAPTLVIIITVSDTALFVQRQANETITSRGLGYDEFSHLPIFCASGRTSFYTYIIPLSLILAGGGPLIFCIVLRLYKKKSAGASELKLLLVLCYYLLLTCVSIADFMVIVRNSTPLKDSLESYFLCELSGFQPGISCPRDFQRYSLSYAMTVLIVVLSFYPLYVLLFAVNITKLKKLCLNNFCTCYFSTHSPIKDSSVGLSEIVS